MELNGSAGQAHHLGQLGIAASLLLGFAFTAVVIKAGNRKDELADAEELEKTKKVAEIEQSNLQLRGQVATLETSAAKQQERAAVAEKNLLELQQRVKDRHLSGEQKILLAKRLKGSAKGQLEIRCLVGNPEGRNFAVEIMDVFAANGWQVTLNDRVLITPTPVGIKVWTHSDNTHESASGEIEAPERITSILKAFEDAHLVIEPQSSPDIQKGSLALIVGFKP